MIFNIGSMNRIGWVSMKGINLLFAPARWRDFYTIISIINTVRRTVQLPVYSINRHPAFASDESQALVHQKAADGAMFLVQKSQ